MREKPRCRARSACVRPIVLRKGSATWALAGVGFPEALMVDLKFVRSQRLLVAATHGLGIFYLQLGS